MPPNNALHSDIRMRIGLILFAVCMPLGQAGAEADLGAHVWNHGSEDCAKSRAPAIEILQADHDSYILRQNKCVHFEAPFIYVLFGEHTVFVQDTGLPLIPASSRSMTPYRASSLGGAAARQQFSSLILIATAITPPVTRSFAGNPA